VLDQFQQNVPLAPFTTFKVGGNARYFLEARSKAEIEGVFAENKNKNIFVLGGGSNVLISDEGFDGIVVKISNKGIRVTKESKKAVEITAQAGEDWDDFVAHCVKEDLAGIECLSGIPGLVGGTPIQNVGAYGQDVSESLKSVQVLDRTNCNLIQINNEDCGFEYRKSIFNSTEKDRYVVLSVTFRLIRNGRPKIEYGDLAKIFVGSEPGLMAVRNGVRSIRESKGMLVRQGGMDSQSAGSFFKNPIVDAETLGDVEAAAQSMGILSTDAVIPRFDAGDGLYKIPAAWLIEKSGFAKGFQFGNAGISGRHSLALINRGDATAGEIIALRKKIREKIEEQFGLNLVTEPQMIGF
jgi:UDP-N-acetylmuramate dehydrogenase